MSGPGLRGPAAKVKDLALAAFVLATSVLAFVPFALRFPINTLDSGWAFALNTAIARGMVFGRDIIFTFGPYAPAYTGQYNPATDAQMLWSSALLAAAFGASLICLAQGTNRLIVAALPVFLVLVPGDTRLFAIPFVALLLTGRIGMPVGRPERIALTASVRLTLVLLAVALGLLPLVKGTFAVASGIAMALSCGLLIMRGKRMLAAGGALLFVLSMMALWMLARQPLVWLPGFFLAQRPIISGYSAAMSLSGPEWQPALFVACSLLFGRVYLRPLESPGLADLVIIIGSAALLFLAFKEGFVRHDAHALVAGGMLALAGWTMLLGRAGAAPLESLWVGVACWALVAQPTPSKLARPFAHAAAGLATRLLAPGQPERDYAHSLMLIRKEQPLPALSGKTDVYSYGQSALLAAGLDWDPRPVLQSYSAYTPGLERKDAAHLTGAHAPDNILFTVQPIDGRLPALADGASWPALLTRYEFGGLLGDMAYLRRRAAPATGNPIADTASVSGTFRLGVPIALPRGAPITWARVAIRSTLLGRFVAFLFRPPALSIRYMFRDGRWQTFRYIPGMGVTGFVASPVIQTTRDFVALALPRGTGYFAERRPAFMSIDARHGAGWLWRSTFTVQLFAMRVPAQPAVGRLLLRPAKPEPRQASVSPTCHEHPVAAIRLAPIMPCHRSAREWPRIGRRPRPSPLRNKRTLGPLRTAAGSGAGSPAGSRHERGVEWTGGGQGDQAVVRESGTGPETSPSGPEISRVRNGAPDHGDRAPVPSGQGRAVVAAWVPPPVSLAWRPRILCSRSVLLGPPG